jgi:hypothetical protein
MKIEDAESLEGNFGTWRQQRQAIKFFRESAEEEGPALK